MAVLIGVTGGVGSGKTEFSKALASLGALVIDADKIAKDLVEDRKIKRQLIDTFGESIFNEAGALKRRELGRLVFRDSALLKQLNHIIHPSMIQEIKRQISINEEKFRLIVVDMALLFELNMEVLFQKTIVITAPPDKRKQWLSENRKWCQDEINQRMESQMDIKEKIEKSDIVVSNSDSLSELRVKAIHIYQNLLFE